MGCREWLSLENRSLWEAGKLSADPSDPLTLAWLTKWRLSRAGERVALVTSRPWICLCRLAGASVLGAAALPPVCCLPARGSGCRARTLRPGSAAQGGLGAPGGAVPSGLSGPGAGCGLLGGSFLSSPICSFTFDAFLFWKDVIGSYSS